MAPPTIPTVQSLYGKITTAKRWHPDTDTTPLEQDVIVSRLVTYAHRLAPDAPALTQRHIDTLAAALADIFIKKGN